MPLSWCQGDSSSSAAAWCLGLAAPGSWRASRICLVQYHGLCLQPRGHSVGPPAVAPPGASVGPGVPRWGGSLCDLSGRLAGCRDIARGRAVCCERSRGLRRKEVGLVVSDAKPWPWAAAGPRAGPFLCWLEAGCGRSRLQAASGDHSGRVGVPSAGQPVAPSWPCGLGPAPRLSWGLSFVWASALVSGPSGDLVWPGSPAHPPVCADFPGNARFRAGWVSWPVVGEGGSRSACCRLTAGPAAVGPGTEEAGTRGTSGLGSLLGFLRPRPPPPFPVPPECSQNSGHKLLPGTRHSPIGSGLCVGCGRGTALR